MPHSVFLGLLPSPPNEATKCATGGWGLHHYGGSSLIGADQSMPHALWGSPARTQRVIDHALLQLGTPKDAYRWPVSPRGQPYATFRQCQNATSAFLIFPLSAFPGWTWVMVKLAAKSRWLKNWFRQAGRPRLGVRTHPPLAGGTHLHTS
jgi:hypothetical protein